MAWSHTQVSPEPCSAWSNGATAVLSPPDGRREDGPLSGGTANRGLVIRVGDTVLRPTAPCWRATHALLAHLSAADFDGAPRVLAVGPCTEALTYIDGRAAVPPLAEETLTDAALVSVADLLRRPSTRRDTPGPARSRPSSGPAWSATTMYTRPTWCSATAALSG
jgi:hypothetical protein